jgi:hypothetical protein
MSGPRADLDLWPNGWFPLGVTREGASWTIEVDEDGLITDTRTASWYPPEDGGDDPQ